MVFLSILRLVRRTKDQGFNKGPCEFHKKDRILRLSAEGKSPTNSAFGEHFYGRARNCYSIAIKKVHRALVYSTKGRKLKREDMRDLWTVRTTAACEELGLPFSLFRYGLQSSKVLLNRKSLADLAIWEPRTFKALVDFSWVRGAEEGLNKIDRLKEDPPAHVVTRGLLKKNNS